MELIKFEKVRDGKYLKNYELTYLNKDGREKKYEMVSRKEIRTIEEVGKYVNGVSIVVTMGEKLLLLKEFRMGINKAIYNLCAGMLEDGETMEECIQRELYEEAGLKVKKIHAILPGAYAAVGISDVKTQIAFVEAEKTEEEPEGCPSVNEEIEAVFYSQEEVEELLRTAEFSSRSQMIAYMFAGNGSSIFLPRKS